MHAGISQRVDDPPRAARRMGRAGAVTRQLTRRSLLKAVEELANADPSLAASVRRYGPPPLWDREPSFATLVHLILEQQVSLASARAAFERLHAALDGDIEPPPFLTLSDSDLRAIGFSRQKAGYARDLATDLIEGFDLDDLGRRADDEVRARLMGFRGIGRWTADIYLIMCLRRPDVWPHGDQALATAALELFGLRSRPSFDELELRAKAWRPHRATAARVLWHHYLSVRGRS
jgi:DNA-3-methyladenine glycosylase II